MSVQTLEDLFVDNLKDLLAVGSIVVLSIFLRQRGSPESKPVAAPHSETGSG